VPVTLSGVKKAIPELKIWLKPFSHTEKSTENIIPRAKVSNYSSPKR